MAPAHINRAVIYNVWRASILKDHKYLEIHKLLNFYIITSVSHSTQLSRSIHREATVPAHSSKMPRNKHKQIMHSCVINPTAKFQPLLLKRKQTKTRLYIYARMTRAT